MNLPCSVKHQKTEFFNYVVFSGKTINLDICSLSPHNPKKTSLNFLRGKKNRVNYGSNNEQIYH
nr:hypothetical protein [Mucilaginibacter sp. X5P1]